MLAQCTKARVGLSRPARAARSAHPGLQIRPLYNSCILRTACRAQPENPEPTESKQTKELNALLDQLKKQGLDKTKAKAVLRKWEELGVKDSEQLRKLLIRRSLRPAIGIGFQTILDFTASYGAFYVAGIVSDADPFVAQSPIKIAALLFGWYYALQAMLNLSVIGTLSWTAYKYGTNSEGVLAAVQAMAGPVTGLSVVDKAQVAANTIKVVATLDEIANLLKEIPSYNTQRGTLQNLSAYLTLSRAKSSGFSPEAYGLSEADAGEIAYVFSLYDLNDDARLELSELKKLCGGLGKDLDDAEVQEAMRILDTSKNGFVEFDEFVAWWTSKKTKSPVSA